MVQFLFLGVGLRVRLRYAFRDNLRVALFVASVFAIRTLKSGGIFQKVSTECTSHNIVELLLNEFVTVSFYYLFFLLADCAFTTKTKIKWPLVLVMFD